MKYVLAFALSALLSGSVALAQERAVGATLIQLMTSPEKYDKKLVDVRAYLTIEHQPRHAPAAWLWLHQEDAKNLLGNSLFIVPSEQMLRDEEKINNVYVDLRGTFRATPTDGGGFSLEIQDVQGCARWSDPDRPIGAKANTHGEGRK